MEIVPYKPLFLLRIVDAENPQLVMTMPGGGPAERDLVSAITELVQQKAADAIAAHRIGYFRSEAQVRAAINQALPAVVYAAVSETIRGLKWDFAAPGKRPR